MELRSDIEKRELAAKEWHQITATIELRLKILENENSDLKTKNNENEEFIATQNDTIEFLQDKLHKCEEVLAKMEKQN